MTRGKDNPQNNAIKEAARQREAEMKPTPVIRESFEDMQKRATDPVKTEGTTEVSSNESPANDVMRQRFEALERQKDKDIKEYEKQSDGKPKV